MIKINSSTKINTDRASGRPAVIVRGYTDTRRKRWVEIAYKGNKALIEYAQFAADRGAIWKSLSDRELVFVKKADKNSLSDQVEELDNFPPRLIFDRPGWCAGQFVSASGRVFAAKGKDHGAVAFAADMVKCSRKGTHAIWLEQVARPLAGHPIPSFFIMAAFAAPLLELTGRTDNFGFELAGEGGKGKSTTQRLMASVAGPAMEKDRGYISTFYMTPAALERSMRSHADMPFIIDEANLFGSGNGGRADNRKMRDFVFQMSAGTTKGRYDSPQQEGYRFIFVTSANEPFHQLHGEANRDVANAATDRLMSITVPEGDAGVFGSLPVGYENYRQFTLALEAAMAQQFGTAMPKFLRQLVRLRNAGEEALKAKIRQRIDAFKREAGINDNNGSDVRVAEAFGVVCAAGQLARHFGVLPTEFDCMAAALHCYSNFRNTVPIRQSLPERILAIAQRPETMAIDRKSLPCLSNHQIADTGAFLRKVKGEMLLLMTPAFGKKMFPDWNALKDTPDFVALSCANDNGRGRGYHCSIRSNKKVDWFYAFRLPELVSKAH